MSSDDSERNRTLLTFFSETDPWAKLCLPLQRNYSSRIQGAP